VSTDEDKNEVVNVGGHGSPDDELNRREELQQRRLERLSEDRVAGGSKPESGQIKTNVSTEEMLSEYKNKDTTQEMSTTKKKSPRYADVPAYNFEDLTKEQLREEVFEKLDLTDGQKQAAGALVTHAGRGLTQKTISQKSGVSTTAVSRTKAIIETRSDPNEKQLDILRVARENPDWGSWQVAQEAGSNSSYTRFVMQAYRHERIPVDVDEEETQGDTQETSEEEQEDTSQGEDEQTAETEREPGETTYKYSIDETGVKTDRGKTLDEIKSKDHLLSILREFETRVQELEENGAEVPKSLKGRISSLQTQLDELQDLHGKVNGIEKVVDRMENKQSDLERYIHEELDNEGGEDEGARRRLGSHSDRLDSIEESLKTHKEALQDLRQSSSSSGSSSFTTEEKREIIVTLAQEGKDELLDKVIEEL
jgi:cell division protein ZapA (FtsZ GTPase activity inhibitor)